MARMAVVDYGMGNRRSVQKALEHVGAEVELTSDAARLAHADALVLPGVGAFPRAMGNLDRLGLIDPIRASVRAGRPLLGICLGMQLLFERSSEQGDTAGLGLIAGEVRRIEARGLRLPHIGWNHVRLVRDSPLTAGLRDVTPFYHVHSLAVHPADERDQVGVTEYGSSFTTIVQRENVFGVQFHPEKSSTAGLRMLRNLLLLCDGRLAGNESAPAGVRA